MPSLSYSALNILNREVNFERTLESFYDEFRNSDKEILNMIDDLVKIVEKDQHLSKKVRTSYNRITSLKKKFGLI